MRILGIDPGYALLGYGVIDSDGRNATAVDYGVVETKAGAPFPFFEQDLAHIEDAAGKCSGFGSGLVPASDALLCGYLACFSCLSYALGRSREAVLSMTRAAANGGASNTNENGAVALLQAGEGIVREDVFQLLRSLFSDIPYTSLSAWGNRTAKGVNGVNILVGISIALHDLYLKNAL